MRAKHDASFTAIAESAIAAPDAVDFPVKPVGILCSLLIEGRALRKPASLREPLREGMFHPFPAHGFWKTMMPTLVALNVLQRGLAFIIPRLIVGIVAAVCVSACGASDKPRGVQVCCGESNSGPILQPDTPPAIPTTSNDTIAILRYAQYCYRDSNFPDALAWLDTALITHERDPRLYGARGHVLFAMKQYLDAETSYGRAGLYGMPDSYLVYQLGEIKWKTGRYREAIAVFQRGLTYFPENACILNSMGVSYKYLGDNTMSLSCYDRAIRADPKVPFFYDNRSGIRRALGDEDGAINDMMAFRNLSRPPSSTGYRPLVERGLINY